MKSYEYTRPFDYFNFQATASSANGFENVLTRGLLVGKSYEAGPDYRGVWGIYGSYDYISPQTFRVSTHRRCRSARPATWWLTNDLSLEGTGMLGVGYTAVGTAHGTASTDRDYHYGVTPQALLALRLTYGDKARRSTSPGASTSSASVASGTSGGHDNIVRVDAALTWRAVQAARGLDPLPRQPPRRELPRRDERAARCATRSASSTRCSARIASARVDWR